VHYAFLYFFGQANRRERGKGTSTPKREKKKKKLNAFSVFVLYTKIK
jgi:hypothetical protein